MFLSRIADALDDLLCHEVLLKLRAFIMVPLRKPIHLLALSLAPALYFGTLLMLA